MKFLIQIREELQNLTKLKKNLQASEIERILEGIGLYMVKSTRENFEEGGRPKKWKTLKKETKQRKRGTKILVENGLLSGGITFDTVLMEKAVFIGPSGPSAKYGRRHNEGDIGGEPIPKRQFLIVQTEDSEYIDDFLHVSMFN